MKKNLSYLKFLLLGLISLYTNAQTTTFNYLPSSNPSLAGFRAYGQIQSYLIPAGVSTVTITAAGGTSMYNNNAAIVKASYTVTPGMYLNILVAGRGGEACGGGGTFVTYESVNRNGASDFSTANNVDKLILAAGGAGSNAAASTTLAPNPTSLTANNGGGSFGGIAGGNGGASTDTHPALPGTKYGGYGGGGAYGFSNGGSGGGGFGSSAGNGTPTSTYGGGGGFSGGTGFAGGTSWISNATLGVIAGTLVGTVSTTTLAGDGYVIIEVVTVSGTILAQIGADADNTTTTTAVTVAQLGQIVPAITGITAANEAAYQAYIDANPNAFSAPATAAEVQAMVTSVNAQVIAQAASDAVLTQIGNEGDSPNTVTAVVTVVQLGAILPAITGIIASNESAYQAYIDAHPDLFSSPALQAEVQAMVASVNTAIANSNNVLAQIGNEGDAPNTVSSVVTVAQLGYIVPAVNGIIAANQTAYQNYIDANPNLFSNPATQAEVQAMIAIVNAAPVVINTFLIGTNCGATLNNLAVTIKTPFVSGASSYTFRITNMATNAAFTVTRPVNSFALSNYAGITFATAYQVEVSSNGGNTYGTPCIVNTPAPTSSIGNQCGTTLASMTQWVYATYQSSVSAYRFRITNSVTNAVQVYDAANGMNRFNFNQLPAGFRTPGTVYAVAVALRNTNGSYLPYGTSCNIMTPGTAPASSRVADMTADFAVVAYPNPFAENYMLDLKTTAGNSIQISVYDMLGRQIEYKDVEPSDINNIQFGLDYKSGVYNVIVSQGENTRTLRVIKR